jgi:hypothetical protein
LCFAAEFKLRTVIWEFSGEKIETEMLHKLEALLSSPPSSVTELLQGDVAESLLARTAHLIGTEEFPGDETGQRYPWPLV